MDFARLPDEDLVDFYLSVLYEGVAADEMAAVALDSGDAALRREAVERRPTLERLLEAERARTELAARLVAGRAERADELRAAGGTAEQIAEAQGLADSALGPRSAP